MISNKYEPNFNVINGGVTELQFKIDGITCSVQEHLDLTCPDDVMHEVTENERQLYESVDREFYNWLINSDHLSQLNDHTMNILDSYGHKAINGYFNEYYTHSFNTVDYNKAYTSGLQDIDYFPKFNLFDLF